MSGRKPNLEGIEKAKTLHEMGWSGAKIAKELGFSVSTILKWIELPDPPEVQAHLDKFRAKNRKRYVDEAWDLVFQLNEIVRQKIKKGESAFNNAKDAAITSAIFVDKIAAVEARGGTKAIASPIQINILPPNGNTTRTLEHTIPIPDEPVEVLSDGEWCGGGEDVLRLPEGDNGSNREPRESRDDNSEYLQEPERLHSPDADISIVAIDGEE